MNKLFIFLLLGSLWACSPNTPEKEKEVDYKKLTWKDLDSLKVDYYFDADYGDYLGKPVFSDKIKDWDGISVIIEGYWIPLSEIGDSSVSVLSALPFAKCFFCSGAGIETVMQIKSNGSLNRIDTDAKVSLKGKLFLNKNNPMELYYQLLEASLN
ncbi:MAG: hypothetical protein RLZZ417_1430 [Bacteroidota bacterium]|jgi:hypothetical protein